MTRILSVVLVLLATAILFDVIDDPPKNFVALPATIVAYQPPRSTPAKIGGFDTVEQINAVVWVRMPDGSIRQAEPFNEPCKIGGEATATARVGRIRHRIIRVLWVICGEKPE